MTQNLHIDHLILKQAFKTAFLIEHLKVMLQWLYKFDGGLNIIICCNIEIVANLIYAESDVNLLPVTLFSENPSPEGTS